MSKSLNANTSGKTEYKKKNHYKLKDGDVVYRIVPPMTKFTDNSRDWIKYHSVHFGYKNTEGKLRIFESPLVKNSKTKMIEVPDAALERLNDLKAKLEQARAEGNGPLVAKLNTLVGFKGVYNVDNNYHMNVIGLDGSIGELKIRHKAKLDLDREIKRLESEGFKPLSEEAGVFLVFHRDGTSKETNFKVSAYTVRVDLPGGGKANQEVTHSITPELWARLEEEAFDLNNLFNKPTAEEVAQIVSTSDLLSGKSPACDEIFDKRWKAQRAAKEAQDNDSGDSDLSDEDNALQQAMGSAPAKTEQPQTLVAPTVQVTAPTTPKTVVTPKSVVVPPTAVVAQTQNVDEIPDDEFFKMIGVQQ